MGRVSFSGLHVIVMFDPETLVTDIRHIDYGATTEKPTDLLTNVFGSQLKGNTSRQFFKGYFSSVFFKIWLVVRHDK